MQSSATSNQTIDSFVNAINDGIKSWKRAGVILVELKRKDPQVFVKIIRKFPLIKMSVLDVFYQVGIGKIIPDMLLLPNYAAKQLLKKTPLEQQEFINNGVEINGKRVAVAELSRREISQAFRVPKKTIPDSTQSSSLNQGVHIGNWAIRKTIGNNLGFERTNAEGINPVTVILQDGLQVIRVYQRVKKPE